MKMYPKNQIRSCRKNPISRYAFVFILMLNVPFFVSGSIVKSAYAFSMNRQGKKLVAAHSIKTVGNISSSIQCVSLCMRYGRRNGEAETKKCVAVNFSKDDQICELLSERICDNEKGYFKEDPKYSYFDVEENTNQMTYWNTVQCKEEGKCTENCYKFSTTSAAVPSTTTTTLLTTTDGTTTTTIPYTTTTMATSPTTPEITTTTSAEVSTTTTSPTPTTTIDSTTTTTTNVPPITSTTSVSTTTTAPTTTSSLPPTTTTTTTTTTTESITTAETTTTTEATITSTTTIPVTTTDGKSTTTAAIPKTTTPTTAIPQDVTTSSPCPENYYNIDPIKKCLGFVDYDEDAKSVCNQHAEGSPVVFQTPDILKSTVDNLVANVEESVLSTMNITIPVSYYNEGPGKRVGWYITDTQGKIDFGWIDNVAGYEDRVTPPDGYTCCIMVGNKALTFTPRLCEDRKLSKMLCEKSNLKL